MDNAVLLMLSGGRDSFLSACKLLEDEKQYRVYMVTYDNGCICQLDKVKGVADRIIRSKNTTCYAGAFKKVILLPRKEKPPMIEL